MSIYKRIGSLILSLLLVFSMFGSTFAIQTFAATTTVLSTESKSVSAGEQFTVAVNLSNATSVYDGNFTLQYDSSLLTADSYSFGSIVSEHNKSCNLNYQSAGNLIRMTFYGTSSISANGTLVTITFTAKEDVSGTAALQFKNYKMYDLNGSSVTTTANGSNITITDEPVISPTISVANKTVTVGDTFSVPVLISDSESVYDGNFTLQYDSDLLTVNSYSYGSVVNSHNKNCNLDYQSSGNLIRFTFNGTSALSSDGTLVTFNFTAKSEGTAALKFTEYKMYDENGNSIDTTVSNGTVKVEPQPIPPTKELVSVKISSNPTKTLYYIGDSFNASGLNLKLSYSDGSTETITSGFTISDFSSTSSGTKTVTVSYEGFTDTFTVTVETPSITFSSNSMTLVVGDTSTITAITTPSGQSVTWTSSNTSVATVSNGMITAKASGSTTITAKFTYNGNTYSKTCSLTIEPNANIITGQCGSDAYYTINLNANSLDITGTGSLYGWSENSGAPWRSYSSYIKHITIAEGITNIPSCSFYNCTQTTDISIPDTVTNIGYKAFDYCWSLEKIELPESLEEIGQFAFYGCSKLTTIFIPKNVDSIIDINAFGECSSLKTIDVDSENAKFVSIDGILYNRSKTKLLRCPCGYEKDISIIDGVKTIDKEAFEDCQNIEHITLPDSVTLINDDAFSGCKNLETIYLSNKLEKIYPSAFYYCTSLTDINIPDSTNYIGERAFMGCSNLQRVDLSNATCSSLYEFSFAYCTNMETFVFPNGVDKIYFGAFSSCESLKELVLPDSITTIETSAFQNCISLEKIIIPKSVKYMYSNLFENCDSLTIYGYKDTEAETYANDESIPFIALDDKELTSISIVNNPSKTLYYIGDSLNVSGLILKLSYSDGSTETITSGFATSGFSATSAGTKTITVSYKGFTDTFTVTVKTPSIALSASSKSLTVGDSITLSATTTPSGQTVTWTSSNTSVATVSGGTITAKASGSATITAKFTYNGKTYSKTCSVTVADVPAPTPVSLLVISKPAKTTYKIGESLNTSGLKLKLTYSDGSTETITSGFTTSGFSSTTAGTKTVTVKYGSLTTTFTITVEETPPVTSAKYEITSATGTAGSTVEVYVSIANNPGVISLRNTISYDTSALELISVQDCGLLVGYTTPSATISSPYTLRWADSLATQNNISNGRIVKLVFQIKDNVEAGSYNISVTPVEARNVNGAKVVFGEASASINVIDCIIGDTDGDGEVTDWDALVLNRYLAGWNVTIEVVAADVDDDGEVTDWDAIILDRYLAGWNVTIG